MQVILAHNRLSGTIPSSILFMPVTHFALSHNSFNGSIDIIKNMLNILEIKLDNNQFTGTLPPFASYSTQKVGIVCAPLLSYASLFLIVCMPLKPDTRSCLLVHAFWLL